jgi:hypothetical protein
MTPEVRKILETALAFYTGPEKWWGHGVPEAIRPRAYNSRCLWQVVDSAAWKTAAHEFLPGANGARLRDDAFVTLGFSKWMKDVTQWNDAPERTFEDVKARITEALTK